MSRPLPVDVGAVVPACENPRTMTGALNSGSDDCSAICHGPGPNAFVSIAKSIVVRSAFALACVIASRKVPAPLSAGLVTTKRLCACADEAASSSRGTARRNTLRYRGYELMDRLLRRVREGGCGPGYAAA